MRVDSGLILALILECVFFIYYADTLFYRKTSKLICCAIISLGYIAHFVVCTFGNVIINTGMFFILNLSALFFLYRVSLKNAVFQSAILTVLSIASEVAVAYINIIGINITDVASTSPVSSMMLTIASKMLYLIGILIITRMFVNKKNVADINSMGYVLISILTMVVLILLIQEAKQDAALSFICILLIIIDVIVLLLNQRQLTTATEMYELKQQSLKDKIDFEEYIMIKEKSEQMRIFHHDFKEHVNALNSLISKDNNEAKAYIKTLCDKEYSSQYIAYTDNKMLNIILSKKKEECNNRGVQFTIEPIQASLKFFNDMDTVSIFSNLINNAIESSVLSADKKIFFGAYTANENFIIIKIENSSDKKPFVIEGKLRTHKDNSELHGIGVDSIKQAIKNYNGIFKWKYNAAQRIFCATITVQK